MIAAPAFNPRVSFVEDVAVKDPPPPRVTTLRDILAAIGGGRWEKQVAAVRDAFERGGKDAANPLKSRLPAAMFTGVFSKRGDKGISERAGLLCADLDELGNQVDAVREQLAGNPHILAAFRSPTGSGLKVIVRIDPEKDHAVSFRAAERFFAEQFGLEIDGACKNVERLCFVSHDPEIFEAKDADVLPYPPEPVQFKEPEESRPVATGKTPGTDYNERGPFLDLLVKHGWRNIRGPLWRRPGKDSGTHSATWNGEHFFVFSDNAAPFEPYTAYRPFAVYAFLEHKGDFKAAARKLAEDGYGEPRKKEAQEPPAQAEANASAIEAWATRRAGFGRVIPPRQPIIYLRTVPIFSLGNLELVTALQKSGKTAVGGAILGALVAGGSDRGDTLGLTGKNPSGHSVIYFDSEQSPDDHEAAFATSLRRADVSEAPAWLYSYGVKGVGVAELHSKLRKLLDETKQIHGGVLAVILDGVAEFVTDPNDPKECNPFVTGLESITTEFNCCVIAVLHLNPSPSGQPTKSRGHLGSQLERKCETDLRLVKDAEGITTLYTACARHAPIMEKDGQRFKWSDIDQMHVSLAGTKQGAKESEKTERLRELAEDVWGEDRGLRYTEIIPRIMAKCRIKDSGAETKFSDMRKFGVITKEIHLWRIAA